jgi:hypothetical protein
MGDEEREGIAARRSRRAGADDADPYAEIDRSDLPAWWRAAVEEFEAHGLRPYRPPRFADGVPTHAVVPGIEEAFGVEVAFTSVDSDYREEWEVRIDGEVALTVGRHRSPAGYTVYELDSEAFLERVREALDA